MNAFEFATAGRIVFGWGRLAEVGKLAGGLGQRACVVTGSGGAQPERLLDRLSEAGLAATVFTVDGEPTVELATAGRTAAQEANCDLVIGFGGGSALDTSKAIAALATNPGDPLDYLEVIGAGQALTQPPLPVLAIPTTAGTGSEVTRNAVLASAEHQVKVSLRSPLMLPRVALIDPELTLTLPKAVTASTGMDALVQVLEPFVSVRANPLVDALCREGLRQASWALRDAYRDGSNQPAREAMSLVSLLGGLCLANAGLGAVHGFAAPIGGMFPAPHGAVCAALLAPVCQANLAALRRRQPDSPVLARYQEIAQILTGRPDATAADGLAWLTDLASELEIPPLSTYGVSTEDLPVLVERGAAASSMQANPIRLEPDELTAILERAL